MLTDKQKDRYLKSKQFQKDCDDFNKLLNKLLSSQASKLSDNKFNKFSEIVIPTVMTHHMSNWFQHHMKMNEDSVDSFIDGIKGCIMDNCDIEYEKNDYTFIEDLGATA